MKLHESEKATNVRNLKVAMCKQVLKKLLVQKYKQREEEAAKSFRLIFLTVANREHQSLNEQILKCTTI